MMKLSLVWRGHRRWILRMSSVRNQTILPRSNLEVAKPTWPRYKNPWKISYAKHSWQWIMLGRRQLRQQFIILGNTSSQCASLRRVDILEEYNKDLVSFSQESEDFCLSSKYTFWAILYWESSKASEAVPDSQTSKGSSSKSSQGFSRPPILCSVGREANPTCFSDIRAATHTPKWCRKEDHSSSLVSCPDPFSCTLHAFGMLKKSGQVKV